MATRFLKRFILPSDSHDFVGRIYDLSIVSMHFDSYEELSKHADCKYAFDVNESLSALTRRVESLNMVGGVIWPEGMPRNFKGFPVSRYEWLNVSADVFLGRYISVADCALILINDVFECGLSPRACTRPNLQKQGVSEAILAVVSEMIGDQGELRDERNGRFHHGSERGFSSDDQMFWLASLFEHRYHGAKGPNGRPLPVQRYFREGLVELQREFNVAMRIVVKHLDRLYDKLSPEFEARFSPKFREGPFANGPLDSAATTPDNSSAPN